MSERHHFQAEIQQLLDIVIHSLYTDREIFIRELVSNAADACEKLRFLQSSGTTPVQPEIPLAISVKTDESAGTITIADTGVGMSQSELVENLGTIARSGTKAFVRQLAEQQKPDAHLIGQFGVGFYSAFMVASRVTVLSRSCQGDEQGWKWTSENAGGYELEPAPLLPRGTQVILELKDDAKDFAKPDQIEQLVKRYSNFIQFPIELNGTRLNTIQAIWSRPKQDVADADYNAFYQYVGHDHDEPMLRLHFTADAPIAIQTLLFVPKRNWENLGLGRTESGINLYCKKVLIRDHATGLLPEWLRFVKGVVDSEDLPLNISRETMQDTALVQKLNKALTGRFLKFLDETAEKEPAQYETFYGEYGRFIKEGIATDFAHREALGRLLRYESSITDKGKVSSLKDYVGRMPTDQKEIFYLLAATREAAEASPYYEVFRSRGFEVLFLNDPWDEFVMEHLHDFDGKPLRAAEKAEIEAVAAPARRGRTRRRRRDRTRQVAQGETGRADRGRAGFEAARGESGGRRRCRPSAHRQHATDSEGGRSGQGRGPEGPAGSGDQPSPRDHRQARCGAANRRGACGPGGRADARQRPRGGRVARGSGRDGHACQRVAGAGPGWQIGASAGWRV